LIVVKSDYARYLNAMKSSKLLKQYVKEVLKEDIGDGYAFGDYGYDASSPFGMDFGGPSLYNVFVQPFTDVLKTAKAGGEQIAASARATLKTAFEITLSSIIPFFAANFKDIFDKEKEDLRKIKEKYREVFDRTDAALGSDELLIWAFLVDPSAVLTAKAAKKSARVVIDIFKTLAGTSPELLKYLRNVTVNFKDQAKKITRAHRRHKYGDFSIWYDSFARSGTLIEEANDPQKYLISALTSPEFKKLLASSPIVAGMKKDALSALNTTLHSIIGQAKKIDSLTSIDQIKSTFPEADFSKFDALSDQDKTSLGPKLVQSIKSAGKNVLKKSLQSHIEHVESLGLPTNHPLVTGYQKAIASI